jgi:hypothetical protein
MVLERELSHDVLVETGNESDVKHGEKEPVEVTQGKLNGKGKQAIAGVGRLMEKRSGGVELKGRRGDCEGSGA